MYSNVKYPHGVSPIISDKLTGTIQLNIKIKGLKNGVALATGSMRILNNKHWLSDVITGAGIGIASVELSYLLLPAWNKLLRLERKNKNLVIVPVINKKHAAFGFVYKF